MEFLYVIQEKIQKKLLTKAYIKKSFLDGLVIFFTRFRLMNKYKLYTKELFCTLLEASS